MLESTEQMAENTNKTCPRCGRVFVCRANAVDTCDCMGIRLSAQALEAIRDRYADCLCAACLHELHELHELHDAATD